MPRDLRPLPTTRADRKIRLKQLVNGITTWTGCWVIAPSPDNAKDAAFANSMADVIKNITGDWWSAVGYEVEGPHGLEIYQADFDVPVMGIMTAVPTQSNLHAPQLIWTGRGHYDAEPVDVKPGQFRFEVLTGHNFWLISGAKKLTWGTDADLTAAGTVLQTLLGAFSTSYQGCTKYGETVDLGSQVSSGVNDHIMNEHGY